jgi:hypothetical protein
MLENQRILELALKGLEAERSKIDHEITDLMSQIGRQGLGKARTDRKTRAGVAGSATGSSRNVTEPKPPHRRLTAAGRKKLSDAAKRRWAANRKTGKTTL